MRLILANTAGYWALGALLVVLAIHLFQQQAKRVTISTLFLIEHNSPVDADGRAIDWIRASVPLFLQLLAAAIIAWLLLEPRWLSINSTQYVAVVLDSSLSMSAFRDRVSELLPPALGKFERTAEKVEWLLTDSNPQGKILYQGESLPQLLAAIESWQPSLGSHDIAPALREARSATGQDATMIFVSDKMQKLPTGVSLFAVGEPLDNVGFTGVNIAAADGQLEWEAMVVNHGASLQNRRWHLEIAGQQTAAREISLNAGQAETLRGVFPAGATEMQVVLSGDRFESDDRLPLVSPQKKQLRIRIAVDAPMPEFFKRFYSIYDELQTVGALHASDLVVRSISGSEKMPEENGIYFTYRRQEGGPRRRGAAVGANHPLVEGLSWYGLTAGSLFPLRPAADDSTLVWLDGEPAVILRQSAEHRQLLFNFSPLESNVRRLPAFVILLHRFTEEIRARKTGQRRTNLEFNQTVGLSVDPEGPEIAAIITEAGSGKITQGSLSARDAPFLRAPAMPSYLTIKQGEELERHGVHFADAREANLSGAVFHDGTADAAARLSLENSEEDALFPLWLTLLAAALLFSWHYIGRGKMPEGVRL